jgi:hypothetical protein
LADDQIAPTLARLHGGLLLRGSLQTLLARREMGGVLYQFAKRNPKDRDRFEWMVRKMLDVSYATGRLHIQLWVHWSRIELTLERLQLEAHKRRVPFRVPGLQRLLREAGIVGQRRGVTIDIEPPRVLPPRLPDDIAELKAIVRALMADNRQLRGVVTKLRGDNQYSELRRHLLAGEIAKLRATVGRYRRERESRKPESREPNTHREWR